MKKDFILIIIILLVLILSRIFNIYIPCVFNLITGLYCPGCGITRMFLSLLKLDFYQAFRYNQLVFIMLPFIFLLSIDYIYSRCKKKKSLYEKIPNIVWIILLVITILFGILRNIFPYFAPTTI